MPPYLFVYGTLQRRFENRYARALRAQARFLGKAVVPGRLYRVAHYPGLTDARGSGEIVHGEVYRLHSPARTLRLLDQYEGDEYARITRVARLATGQPLKVQIYVYRHPVCDSSRIVRGKF